MQQLTRRPAPSKDVGFAPPALRVGAPGTWPLADLALRVPVVQAPLGACDGPRLAGAVSRAGALGCLTVHATPADKLRRRLAILRSITPRPALIAFTAEWQRETVTQTCLDVGCRHYQVFWWNGPRLIRPLQRAGATVFWQVGTPMQAHEALDAGADVLVVQGTQAGGQVRSPYPLRELLTELVVETKGRVPIVAGGGLADAHDVTNVLSWGASAALLGTRFLLTHESTAPTRHKARLLRASHYQLHLDGRMVGNWPCAPRRRLRTHFDEDAPSLLAGHGIGRINDVSSAADVLRRLAPRFIAQREDA